ncbi:MAG: hypothetical protein ABI980_14015 [Nitrospirota bacterium]
MLWFKLFLVSAVIAIGGLSVEAADLEMKLVDKNCWIEVFDDSKYDAKNPHAKLQGPKEYATLKNVEGKDWSNDIQSVIVGTGATVRAYKERDFQGPEIVFTSGQRVPKLSKLGMSNDIESMKIMCEQSDLQTQPSSGNMSDQNRDRTGTQPSDRPSGPPSSTSTTTTTTVTPGP